MSIFAHKSVQILLIKRPLLQATGQRSAVTAQMKKGEAKVTRAIHKRRAVERGRRICNATISLILRFVVTAAAQSERINQEGRILGPRPVVPMALVPGSGYKIPKNGARQH
jgi:hypothetical protein